MQKGVGRGERKKKNKIGALEEEGGEDFNEDVITCYREVKIQENPICLAIERPCDDLCRAM